MLRRITFCIAGVLCLIVVPATHAQSRPIELSLDATDAPRRLLHAKLKIQVKPGPLTLYYPKWIQGEHSANGPINDLAGLKLSAGGKTISWRRDELDLYSFHCTVPDGVDTLDVALDYLGSGKGDGHGIASSAPCMTANLAVLSWHMVVLYPKGTPVRDLAVRAELTLPAGWRHGSALPIDSQDNSRTQFKAVSLETLVDSPVVCGKHFKEILISPQGDPPVYLTLACENPAGLEIPAELRKQYERLVTEASALFGARHYRSYRFLVAMSDHLSHNGLEHHESSDNRAPEKFLIDDSYRKTWHSWLLPHEYVHTWNGKYRRPDGLVLSDFQKPQRTSLLWVYEGLTQYLGFVLAARSGLHAPEGARENLAIIADWAQQQRGRAWRSLEDTSVAAPQLYFARSDWASRRRGVDFYDEGALLWLDVDTAIREKTGGKRSLDDFCRAFFGGKDSGPEVRPYSMKDLVDALNAVAENDWQKFLERRVTFVGPEPPLDGINRGGWKLTYRDKPGDVFKAREADDKTLYHLSSIGLLASEDGKILDVIPGKAADQARLGPGMKILSINDRKFSADRLQDALAATANGNEKLRVVVEHQESVRTVTLTYTGGARYPFLTRTAETIDYLTPIFRPVAVK